MQTSGDNKPGWADNPVVQQRIRYALYAICGLLIIVDLLVDRHNYLPVEDIPAFYAFYGFAALVGLVELSKALRKLVGRKEDYYDGYDDDGYDEVGKVEVGNEDRGDDNHAV